MTLAVFTKAMIPAGFMPNEGMTAMVICSGTGEKTVMVPTGEEVPADHQIEACAYHLAAAQKIVPIVLTAIPVASNPQIPHQMVLEEQFSEEPFITAASPRGPPAFV